MKRAGDGHGRLAFLRKYVPGFEESYVVQSGVQVGVRETRRVLGEYPTTPWTSTTRRAAARS
jgi:hypothetical protein